MVHGWGFKIGRRGELACPQCTALAPNPDTDDFRQWLAEHPGLDAYLTTNNEVVCADPTTEKTVWQVVDLMFHSVTNAAPYTTPSHLVPLKRRMKAYAVDHAEPGRVRQLLATNGGNHHDLTVVPGTTPTQAGANT